MKFTTDSYIEMGTSHNICEDYALNGIINGEIPYIIVSDGCSSSKMTDLGSRIMAHSCRKALYEKCSNIKRLAEILEDTDVPLEGHLRAEIYLRIKHIAMVAIEQFGLSYDVCDATLLYAFIYDGKLHIQGYGDGNVIIKFTDGTELWDNIQYESNAPFYLSYDMDLVRQKGYENNENFGGKGFRVDRYVDGNLTPDSITQPYNTRYEWYNLGVSTINSITLSSDGMESYSHAHKRLCTDPPPSKEEIQSLKPYSIMQRMVAYKNHNGEFVKRRMKRMRQEVEKIQGEHYDDVSSATIWIDHE